MNEHYPLTLNLNLNPKPQIMQRRKFIKNAGISGLGITLMPNFLPAQELRVGKAPGPVCIATWNFHEASKTAGALLDNGASALDAVEKGVMVEEANLKNHTVGNGGAPDRDGDVTLDACIMAPDGNCGSVAYLKKIQHPVSVARRVMEKTPHVMLVGEGALQFAVEQGFETTDLLTQESRERWQQWLKEKEYRPIINIENHDTIGMIGLDEKGKMAGSCTTSGLAYKMHGRVGDSPLIGAGLFVDEEVGAATATGLGEAIIRICGSFLIVELMRQGRNPQEACEEAVRRLIAKNKNIMDIQAGFLALNKEGEYGAYAVHPGFNFALHHTGGKSLLDSTSKF